MTDIISSEYAYGTVVTGPPAPADKPENWHPPTLTEDAVLRRYGATSEQLDHWRALYGFPAPKRTTSKTLFGSWRVTRVREWSEESLLRWEQGVREITGHLPKARR
jgi:hypothetical protein